MTIPALQLRTPGAASSRPLRLAAGTYVTDERNLFRCVSAAPADETGATALLEDCRSLDLVVFPMSDLDPAKLRVVEPEMGGTGLEPVTSCL